MPVWTSLLLITALSGGTLACGPAQADAVYDADTRLVRRIDYDADRDGRIEARLYFREGRPVRLEADGDADGRIDRREVYGSDGALARLGTSAARDGRVDTWITRNGDAVQVAISTRRDGVFDRREFHMAGAIERVELDTNADGRIDTWQRFDSGRLREVAVDTTFASSRPDRRLVYHPEGSVAAEDAGR